MTEWALPPEQGRALEDIVTSLKNEGRWDEWRPFVRGGVWDNFLVKYDEANRMHKKMLFLSERAGHDDEARNYLWRAQCNCAYWHGVFGGLYLGHLRRAVHENLLKAQARIMEKSGDDLQMQRLDFDKDGAEEILILNRSLSLGLDPNRGGGMFDICHLPEAVNLSDTLTRRPEAYHRHINEVPQDGGESGDGIASIHDVAGAGDEDLERRLVFDAYTRASLLDHFLGPGATPEGYAANEYPESGDFVQGRYRVEQADVSPDHAIVEMSRTGQVNGVSFKVSKTIRAGKDAHVIFEYAFECQGHEPVSTLFGCEFNLTAYSDEDRERYYRIPEPDRRREIKETGSEDKLTHFELVNGPDRLCASFSFSSPVSVWFFPLMTISKSEKGFERTYQGSSLLFLHPLNLSPGQKTQFQIELELIEL